MVRIAFISPRTDRQSQNTGCVPGTDGCDTLLIHYPEFLLYKVNDLKYPPGNAFIPNNRQTGYLLSHGGPLGNNAYTSRQDESCTQRGNTFTPHKDRGSHLLFSLE